MLIEFVGTNLPSLDGTDIQSNIPFTFTHEYDTSERQYLYLQFNAAINAVTLTFDFAGNHYECNIFRGATVEGIAYGPNAPVQPPITETWTGQTNARVYLLAQATGEVVTRWNWEVPPQIASTEVIIQEDGDNYAAKITPIANPPAGNYVIKYCNQPLINVTVN